ncbi:alanine racemase [Ameyamaea chiangmaiensis]|nr:alanine racemase [Ameyamaea chiangmaiensis]MBS4075189.1 alanine racemase [Ameyamaea chiangmaiensis]
MPCPQPSTDPWPVSRAGAVLTIDLDAIVANHRRLAAQAGGATCAAVLKADAYGVGAQQVATALAHAGVREFLVAHVDEGISLRAWVPTDARVTVLHGPRPGAEADCARHALRPVLNTRGQIARWREAARLAGHPLDTAVQIDSGMSRFGLSETDIQALADDPRALDGLSLSLVMSHLACADDPADPANAAQRDRFVTLADRLPRAPRSLAASSGIFLGDGFHFDLVRPGVALYGVAPNRVIDNPLASCVRLDAHVLQIREVGPGDGVGYGLSFRPGRPMRIGTIAVGYADGFARRGAAAGCAWFGDIRLPVLGRISMDSMSVDLSDIPERLLRDDMAVELIGPHRTIDDVAEAGGTIGYEILTSLGRRYHRVWHTA